MRASDTGELSLDEVLVPDANRLPGARGLRAPLSCLNEARYGIAWGAVGAAADCYHTALTYGLERIAMYLQDVGDVFDLEWGANVRYRDVRREEEYQLSRYSFEQAGTALHRDLFDRYLSEGWKLLDDPERRSFLAAYDWCLKSSHVFNILDARGAISVSERAQLILKIRKLACAVAAAYVAHQTAAVRESIHG